MYVLLSTLQSHYDKNMFYVPFTNTVQLCSCSENRDASDVKKCRKYQDLTASLIFLQCATKQEHCCHQSRHLLDRWGTNSDPITR